MENLKSLKQWVVWKFERRGGQMTKIPYMTNGTTASSTNADTWALYNDVKSKSKYFSGIGLVLTKESNILFIDLDKCLDDLPPEFRQLIDSANTYTEVSPSGTGLHLLLRVSGDFNLNANRSKKMPHFEVYNTGRYATITEAYFESRTDIRTVTPEEATSILSIVGYPWKETYEKISTHKKSSFSLTTNDVLERMFASKNGRDIKELYNGDILKYNDDESSADMALCMHLAFWFQKDKEKIREAWTLSPLGNRKKTQERIDYQERTLNACIEKTNDVYTSPEEVIKQTTGEYLQLQKNDKGVPFVNVTNLAYIISIDPFLKSSFRYNDFFKIEETSLSKNNKWVGFDKQHTIEVMIHIQKNYPYFERTALALVEQAILNSTHNNVVNEPKQYIESLEWDGTPLKSLALSYLRYS